MLGAGKAGQQAQRRSISLLRATSETSAKVSLAIASVPSAGEKIATSDGPAGQKGEVAKHAKRRERRALKLSKDGSVLTLTKDPSHFFLKALGALDADSGGDDVMM